MASIDDAFASFLGGPSLQSFVYKFARGTMGGILLLWNDDQLEMHDIVIRNFSISVTATLKGCPSTFLLTVVHGSKPDDDKKWLVVFGDFNLI